MGYSKFFEDMIEKKLLGLHTAYLAKVLAVNGDTAKIQPLGLTKSYNQPAKAQSPLSNVPIIRSARYKLTISSTTLTDAVVEPLAVGDIVLCVCCERDITAARRGSNALPPVGHHQQGDSVIVGVL